MKAGFFLFLFIHLFLGILQAQQTRGIKPIASKSNAKGTTRAIVIGISDYQNPLINDLKYAHKDAEEFAKFLMSTAGGSVRPENIKLLLNEQATGSQINLALEWLTDSCKAGDRAIFYFAGHGDVESKQYNQPGFLLPWDAPNRSYWMNALKISDLQGLMNELSINKKTKVILITDACRSGKLAGSPEGPKLASYALQELFKNQVLILSCQPDEMSIEGDQWGGGRGVFSYYFLKGLKGEANSNRDSVVTVLEIGRYLQDHVLEDVRQYHRTQTPITQGNLYEILAYVSSNLQNSATTLRDSQALLFHLGSRDLDSKNELLRDTSLLQLFAAFEQALQKKEFLFPVNGRATADTLYLLLMQKTAMQPIKNYLNQYYSAALQDDAQQVLSNLLNVDTRQITKSKIARMRQYKNYPKYLHRAAELLGEQHFLFKNIKARQYFFEGLLLYLENSGNKNVEEGTKIMNAFRQSLKFEPYGPHTYFYMMCCQATKFGNRDSAVVFALEAEKCSSNWILPYAYLSMYFSYNFKDPQQAKLYLDKAMEIDSQQIMVLNSSAAYHYYNKEYAPAEKMYKKIIALDSFNEIAWLNLGALNLAYHHYAEAEFYLHKAYELDSLDFDAFYYLGILYIRTSNYVKAEQYLLKSIELNPSFVNGRRELARIYREQKRNEEAEKVYKEMINFDSANLTAYYELACLAALNNRKEESINYLEAALKNGFKDFDAMKKDDELINISKSEAFIRLIEKYNK